MRHQLKLEERWQVHLTNFCSVLSCRAGGALHLASRCPAPTSARFCQHRFMTTSSQTLSAQPCRSVPWTAGCFYAHSRVKTDAASPMAGNTMQKSTERAATPTPHECWLYRTCCCRNSRLCCSKQPGTTTNQHCRATTKQKKRSCEVPAAAVEQHMSASHMT